MGQAREKTQTGGVVMSYRYEDGSLQKLLEERPELLGESFVKMTPSDRGSLLGYE